MIIGRESLGVYGKLDRRTGLGIVFNQNDEALRRAVNYV